MIKKIYIMGPVGSGKSTLAKKLSRILSISNYELDNIIYNCPERTERKKKKY